MSPSDEMINDRDPTVTINCAEHGQQQQTFVCQHIVEGLRNGRRLGFYSATEPENPRPGYFVLDYGTIVGSHSFDVYSSP